MKAGLFLRQAGGRRGQRRGALAMPARCGPHRGFFGDWIERDRTFKRRSRVERFALTVAGRFKKSNAFVGSGLGVLAIASAAWLGYELKLMAALADVQKSPLRPNEKKPRRSGAWRSADRDWPSQVRV